MKITTLLTLTLPSLLLTTLTTAESTTSGSKTTGSNTSGSQTSTGATTSSTVDTAAITQLVLTIPSCALGPLTKAITDSGCSLTDYKCQCTTGLKAITAEASPAILKACSTADGTKTSSITAQVCVLAGYPSSSQSSSATKSATGPTNLAGVLATATPGQCISADSVCNPNAGVGVVVAKFLMGVVAVGTSLLLT